MIRITVLKNPFNHTDKEIHACEHIPGKTAYEYVQPYIMGLDDYVVSINGNVAEDTKEQIINSDDWIAVCPVVGKSGSSWFRSFASIIVGNVLGAVLGTIIPNGSYFWSAVRSATVNMIGGSLINHWFPAAKPDRYEVNPSYNWSNAQPLTEQGNALAVTYGTMRTAGQVLAQHVSSDGEKQYLNLLLCGGEGPLDSISDIRINDNPISYYKGIAPEIRLGTNDQTVIANFNDTYVDQALAYEINNDNTWITHQTEGNAVEGLEITLEFPYGLYYAKDSGGLGNASVTLQAQYNKVGDDNWRNFTNGMSWAVTQNSNGQLNMISVNSVAPTETWTITYGEHGYFIVSGSVSGVKSNAQIYKNYNNGIIAFNITEYGGENGSGFVPGDTFTINVTPNINLQTSAAKNTAFFRTYRVDNLPAAQYEVRVKCIAKSGTNNRYSTRVFWTQLSNIIYDDFARPGKVLVGIKALATNQLSGGMPNITWLQTRSKVWVWNADSGQYEQKPATNPAWAAYDMIHRCRQIKNIHTGKLEFIVKGTPASRAVYQDFARWAAFCDSRSLTFNYIFNTATDLWTALQKPEGVGRGKVIMRGTRYGCVCDAPGEPVQLFTVGNILTDKFKESFVGMKDRANAIEITFANKDKAYQKEVITAYADNYDSTTEPNITQITLDGATTVDQVYREAKYRLRLNQYLQRTVEHSADIDAIACQINDVVLLAHDVPQWGYSGRLLAATVTTLQLDRKVTLEPGKSYAVAVQITNPAATTAQDAQKIVTVGVQGVVNEISTDTVTLTSLLSSVPQKWDLYSFGETSKVVKPFRVLSISRDQDLRRKISCIEYIEEVYTEATDIPEVNYSALETTTEVSNVSVAEETYRQKDGTMVSNLNVAWSIPRDKLVSGYKVLYSSDNGQTWSEWATGLTALSTKIIGVKTQTAYLVKVCTINAAGVVSTGVVSFPEYVSGKDAPPSDVASLFADISLSDCTKITLTWPAVPDIDLRGYQLMEGSIVLTPTPISDTQYIYTATQSRDHNFSVRAIDNSGNPSEIPATKSISVTVEPANVAGFSVAIQETDRSKLLLSWAANSDKDIAYYEIRQGNTGWDAATVIATQLKATSYMYSLAAEGSQTFMIKAVNISGKCSTAESFKTVQVILRPDTPTNLAAVQDPKDRSILKLSWMVSPGKDIAGYQLKYGSTWATAIDIDTTRETSYRWLIPGSGTYNLMVCAQTVAGYISNITSIPVTVVAEPSNVTGFTATQSDTDKRGVKFTWKGIADQDFAYYEIREGTIWNTASVIATKIGSTYYDYKATAEKTTTYLIKAVNKSERYSNDPESTIVAISLTPSRPSSGSVVADFANRLKLLISWDKVTDMDIDYYEVKYGSTVIATPKDTSATYTVTTGGAYTFTVRAKNLAGFYSSMLTLTGNVTAEPTDIATFAVSQHSLDRTFLDFTWTANSDTDLAYYEIRKGTNWDAGTVVATQLKTATYSAAATATGAAAYLIKAFNAAGYGSVNAKAAAITINLNPAQPATGSVSQDPKDKSELVLSWANVTDADLLYYEVRSGTNWATGVKVFEGKETSCRYPITANGTYPFMVCSKNVGGYYSSVLNLSVAATVNPGDITDFVATQSMNNRSIVTLHWNTPTDLDISHFEIRQGTAWDTATIIGNRLTTTSFEIQALDETIHYYFIKAVSIAGYYSQNAAKIEGIFNLNPSPVSNIQINQNTNDRSQLIITWTGINESDLVYYDVRLGYIWDTATQIAETKETRWIHQIDATGDIKIMIKSKNAAEFYSDEVHEHYYATVEPGPVTGFVAIQNGEYVELFWDKHSESDVVAYEITEGASFDMGQLVVSGVTTNDYKVKVDTERNYYYHIKAINRALKYSQNAVSKGLYISNLPVKNIIQEYDEITLQTGIKTNVEFGPSLINWSNIGGRFSDYLTTKFSDVGGQTVLKLSKNGTVYYSSGTYSSQTKDMGQVITANITCDFRSTVVLRGMGSALLQIRTSQDGANWSIWADFKPAQYTFRYLDARVLLATNDPANTPEVNHLSVRIDVPDTDIYKTVTVPVGGATFSYGHTYYTIPVITPTALGANKFVEMTNKTNSSVDLRVVNRSGTDVGGDTDLRIKGY
ncbi:host specificity factor TipJ family phage tail protein [Sporomusa sp.]|uniref:host specificity factor TipJ family phage tail protein n=1 Tax=Sporomusa sp. TaxID=2078658 RepID=UPI002C0B663E|nr:host specificity factor TipJ family phage tail protein [Sporomusa sp.]HWR42551.1 host specificity factor TipJ family phage tail protein [Sporomusa sp.]